MSFLLFTTFSVGSFRNSFLGFSRFLFPTHWLSLPIHSSVGVPCLFTFFSVWLLLPFLLFYSSLSFFFFPCIIMKYCVAIDGSPQSTKAYEMAMTLAKSTDTVLLLTVVSEKIQAESKALAIQTLDELNSKAQAAGVTCSSMLLENQEDARSAIVEAAEKLAIDTLVLGTRGHGVIKRLVMGSVSSYCLAHSSCDVLIVK